MISSVCLPYFSQSVVLCIMWLIKSVHIGTVELDLHGFPRGTKTAKSCKMEMMTDGTEKISIFQQKRTRGWWPFIKSGELTVHTTPPSDQQTNSLRLTSSIFIRAKWRQSSTLWQPRRQRNTRLAEPARSQSRCLNQSRNCFLYKETQKQTVMVNMCSKVT